MTVLSITYARPWPYRAESRAANTARWAHLLTGMARVAGATVAEYRARRAARYLTGFDDLMLRDIGIGRGEIERVVRAGRDLT
jgi:uncharacterized protein YjiS (DUF1127 family)